MRVVGEKVDGVVAAGFSLSNAVDVLGEVAGAGRELGDGLNTFHAPVDGNEGGERIREGRGLGRPVLGIGERLLSSGFSNKGGSGVRREIWVSEEVGTPAKPRVGNQQP